MHRRKGEEAKEREKKLSRHRLHAARNVKLCEKQINVKCFWRIIIVIMTWRNYTFYANELGIGMSHLDFREQSIDRTTHGDAAAATATAIPTRAHNYHLFSITSQITLFSAPLSLITEYFFSLWLLGFVHNLLRAKPFITTHGHAHTHTHTADDWITIAPQESAISLRNGGSLFAIVIFVRIHRTGDSPRVPKMKAFHVSPHHCLFSGKRKWWINWFALIACLPCKIA